MTKIWQVVIYNPEGMIHVRETGYRSSEAAEAVAARRRERIETAGWPYSVSVVEEAQP